MPKIKTKRSAAKRFKKTATGKFKHKKAYLRHILSNKGTDQKRGLRKAGMASKADTPSIRRLLPYG